MEYHEIGERFEYDGVVLEVRECSNLICNDCYFHIRKLCDYITRAYCMRLSRKDKKEVKFVQVQRLTTHTTNMGNKIAEKNNARKNDRLDDKLMWELLPLQDIEDIVKVYTAGAKKYGPDQWQQLPDGYRRYKAAMLRHLVEFEKGNWTDPDTGCIHLAQVAWNAIAMLHIEKENHNEQQTTLLRKEENNDGLPENGDKTRFQ